MDLFQLKSRLIIRGDLGWFKKKVRSNLTHVRPSKLDFCLNGAER